MQRIYTFQDNKKYFYLLQKYFGCPDVSVDVGASTLTVTRKPSTRKARDMLELDFEKIIQKTIIHKKCVFVK